MGKPRPGTVVKAKGVVVQLKPTVRRDGDLQFAPASHKAKIRPTGFLDLVIKEDKDQESDGDHDDEDEGKEKKPFPMLLLDDEKTKKRLKAEQIVRKTLIDGGFKVQLVQLGPTFMLRFPGRFVKLVSQFESELQLYITKKKTKPVFNKLEDMEDLGRVNKKKRSVICLGKFQASEQVLAYDPEDDDNDSNEWPMQSFEYTEVLADPFLWKGVYIAKRAMTPPLGSYPAVYFHANLDVLSEEQSQSNKEIESRKTIVAKAEEKLEESFQWQPGLGLKKINRVIKPKMRYFDRDGSGTIDFPEFKNVMENLGLFLTETRLQTLFRSCDLDQSGEVELNELPLALHINDKLRVKTRMTPRDAFDLFDYDSSGTLSEHEFFEVIQTLAVGLTSRDDATKVFQKHDKDKSGVIEYSEFLDIWLDFCDLDGELDLRQTDRKKKMRKKKKKALLRELILQEEEEEKLELERVCEECYQDARDLRVEIDSKNKEHKKIRRREAVAAKAAISKAEREIRRAKQIEIANRKKMEMTEKQLREELAREIEFRKKKEREDRVAEREFIQKKDRERRGMRGEDRLEMRAMGLRTIPESAYKGKEAQNTLSYLVSMDLSENKLELLPSNSFLFWCGSLRRLNLSHNRLRALPDELETLESLERLVILGNNLREIPTTVSALKALVDFNVAENELVRLPDNLPQNILKLCLYRNKLEQLPEALGTLEKLETLDLSLNQLKFLPDDLEGLKSLRYLDVSWNKIAKFPKSLGSLGTLEFLELSSNELRRLPDTLSGLESLQVLSIGRNQLVEIPSSIEGLVSLLKLQAPHNRILRLPEEIGNMRSIQQIDISQNKLTYLPKSLGKVHNLIDLNAHGNQITSIPHEFGALSCLQKLNLSHNRISGSLPASLGSLKHLTHCELAHNSLTTLPTSFGALSGLLHLNLSNNNLSHLPESFGYLRAIETINLSCNKISVLPISIGNLADTLKTLILSSNLLKWLPREIALLRKLETLDLHHNKLKAIPAELGKLMPHLEAFHITENPLTELPKRFANNKVSKRSGYTDGQVADWVIEISDVYHMCRDSFIFPENWDKPWPQTLEKFETTVQASLGSSWRPHLLEHVRDFYFACKRIGDIPRLECLYGQDINLREGRIEQRQGQKEAIINKVYDQQEAIAIKTHNAYTISKEKLIYTETKLEQRQQQLNKEKRERTASILLQAGRACLAKQLRVEDQIKKERQQQKQKEFDHYKEIFRKEREQYIQECKQEYGDLDPKYHDFNPFSSY